MSQQNLPKFLKQLKVDPAAQAILTDPELQSPESLLGALERLSSEWDLPVTYGELLASSLTGPNGRLSESNLEAVALGDSSPLTRYTSDQMLHHIRGVWRN